MDADEVAWELYGLKPEAFTAARAACAARARRAGEERGAGEEALAKRIAGWRRPTLAVWAANLLARADPEQAHRLLELGRGLREAHRTLAGPELRDLSHQRNVVVAEMARQAAQLAGDAGHPVSDAVQHEVEEILHTLLAEPAAGPAADWARGSLTAAPPPVVGFTGLEPAPGTTPRRAAAPPKPTEPARKKEPASSRQQEREQERERGREREARAKARAEADRAAREATLAETELTAAERELRKTRSEVAELDERISALQDDLARARHERADLHAAEEAAARRHRQADRALDKARRAAAEAERAWKALNR
ncbi:hypothetical protein [Streptomyces katrae]|uniref:Uncharacterized protein n=1 Tax=Streptomyces katrae TaxID=68223 RepID=A0A0F4JIU1_9ACTN|nr:hypothetical protein [Streptomyces katrae]KJY32881.1 hypothetical protein VR44_15080 [Streptomyces katrae]